MAIRNKLSDKVSELINSKTTVTTEVPVSSGNGLSELINSESTTTRKMTLDDWVNKIKDRHNIRLSMAKGTITSGNKNTDKLEKARSSLADYARSEYIKEAEKDSSVDLSVLDKMQDQDIINWMTKDDPIAQQTYIDFINKGGFVKDAYDKIMGIDEEAQIQEEREKSGTLKNFIGSAIYEIPNQIGGLMDITGITDYLNQKKKDNLDKYNQVSTEEYEKYKNGEITFDELKKKGVSGIYMDYENDTNNGDFYGSIEDYGKAMYDKGADELEQTQQEQMLDNFLIKYNPEGKGAGAGKFATQMAEFMTLPGTKLNWLGNTLLGTAEILGLNTLSEGKLPTGGEAATTAALTATIEGLLRLPGGVKFVRGLLSNTSPEVKNALSKTTREAWKRNEGIINKGITATKNEATRILDKAAQGIKGNIKGAAGKLKKLRNEMEGEFKMADYFDSINQRFKNFETEGGWGKNAAPEIKIDKNTGEMTIYNEDALSNVADSNGQKLVDYIKSEWNAFRNQGREDTIKNAEDFMKKLSDKIYEISSKEGGINSADSAVKAILEGTKDAYEKVYNAMGNIKGGQFKKARERYSKLKDYEEFFEKYIGNIRGKKSPLSELEKTRWGEKSIGKGGDFLGDFMKLLKKDKIVKEDLSSQLISLIYSYGIKDPKKVAELIETIYPSGPGMQEIGLSLIRRALKNSEAETLLKDAVPGKLDVWESINNIVRPASQVEEERLLEY